MERTQSALLEGGGRGQVGWGHILTAGEYNRKKGSKKGR